MDIINLGATEGLPPVDWTTTVDELEAGSAPAPDAHNAKTTWLTTINADGITAPFNAPSQGPPPWHVFRIEPTSATVVLVSEPGGLTRFRF